MAYQLEYADAVGNISVIALQLYGYFIYFVYVSSYIFQKVFVPETRPCQSRKGKIKA